MGKKFYKKDSPQCSWSSIVSNRVSSVKRLFEIQKYEVQILASPPLSLGVIGNTSDFGSEESGFEPQGDY